MTEKRYYFFMDWKVKHELGIKYYPAGFVFVEHPDCDSGDELGVTYMSPFGRVHSEHRSHKEVELTEVSKSEYDRLKNCLNSGGWIRQAHINCLMGD